MTLKTFLLAIAATAALLGAAVVGVPTTSDKLESGFSSIVRPE